MKAGLYGLPFQEYLEPWQLAYKKTFPQGKLSCEVIFPSPPRAERLDLAPCQGQVAGRFGRARALDASLDNYLIVKAL